MAAARAKLTVCADVLTEADTLSLVLSYLQPDLQPPTEAGLARFCALAAVSHAWHEALRQMTGKAIALRHAHMFVESPQALQGFQRPSFLEV